MALFVELDHGEALSFKMGEKYVNITREAKGGKKARLRIEAPREITIDHKAVEPYRPTPLSRPPR